jgi:hypothetical protein
LSEEATSPYVPVHPAPRYTGQPVTYEDPYEEYDQEALDPDAEPLRTLPPGRGVSVRTLVVAVSSLALVLACAALLVSLGSGVLGRMAPLSGALATQTAVASLRPPVNTPISILPTIPLSGAGEVGTGSGSAAPPPVEGEAQPASTPQPPSGPVAAPIEDAVMCARLEGGRPLGTTDRYTPTDPFNLAVKAQFGQGGVVSVLTRWYGPGNTPIYDLRQSYTQAGSYYAGFTLSKKSPWDPGDYRVDIYTNDSPQPISSVSFVVAP